LRHYPTVLDVDVTVRLCVQAFTDVQRRLFRLLAAVGGASLYHLLAAAPGAPMALKLALAAPPRTSRGARVHAQKVCASA